MEKKQISINELLLIIGAKEVEIQMLKNQKSQDAPGPTNSPLPKGPLPLKKKG
jgi:hypothetical protein